MKKVGTEEYGGSMRPVIAASAVGLLALALVGCNKSQAPEVAVSKDNVAEMRTVATVLADQRYNCEIVSSGIVDKNQVPVSEADPNVDTLEVQVRLTDTEIGKRTLAVYGHNPLVQAPAVGLRAFIHIPGSLPSPLQDQGVVEGSDPIGIASLQRGHGPDRTGVTAPFTLLPPFGKLVKTEIMDVYITPQASSQTHMGEVFNVTGTSYCGKLVVGEDGKWTKGTRQEVLHVDPQITP